MSVVKLFFLFLKGYKKELSLDDSYEHIKHMLKPMYMKIIEHRYEQMDF